MQALIDYIGGLILAGGDHDGERFSVLPWQRRFLRGAFRLPGDAALSCGRGNGKSPRSWRLLPARLWILGGR